MNKWSLVVAAAAIAAGSVCGETYRGGVQEFSLATTLVARGNDFNADWKFAQGDIPNAESANFDDSGWQRISVPHDFMIHQPFTINGSEGESGYFAGGVGWYRKDFILPEKAAGKRVVVAFDGVANLAAVFVNGEKVGENRYAYNNFEFDITDKVRADGVSRNTIAVRVETKVPCSRWYSGSGVLRPVELLLLPPVHVAPDGVYITTPNLAKTKGKDGTVRIVTEVVNASGAARQVRVRQGILAPGAGKEFAAEATSKSVSIGAGATVKIENQIKLANPRLWDIDGAAAALYTVVTRVESAAPSGEKLDTVRNTLGYRWTEWNEKEGFKLNGRKIKLNGVCLHHDQGALGGIFNETACRRQLEIMREMGANAVRTAHNPYARGFYKLCDEMGILVCDEIFDGWDLTKNGNANDFAASFNKRREDGRSWAQYVVEQTIRRDRNSPSVFVWDLGNEIAEGINAPSIAHYPKIIENLIGWVKALDDTRPYTVGDNKRNPGGDTGKVNDIVAANGGIVGVNYPINGVNRVNVKGEGVKRMMEKYKVLMISESASAINSRGTYKGTGSGADADGKNHLTSFDTSAVGWGTSMDASIFWTYSDDRRLGEFVWTGFDYIGEPTPWNRVGGKSGGMPYPNSSYFGRVDTAGFPKDSFYLIRSQWKKAGDTLHIAGAWDAENLCVKDGKAYFEVYADVPAYKLYLDGKEIASARRESVKSPAGHVMYKWTAVTKNAELCTVRNGEGCAALSERFLVKFDEGKTLSAKAFTESGKEIAETVGVKLLAKPQAAELAVTVANAGGAAGGAAKAPRSGADGADATMEEADADELIYFEIAAQDSRGILKTTADDELSIELVGGGEIVGVDNGDQATVEKFANPLVLLGAKRARIKLFAGRALAIVRPDAGGAAGETLALKVSAKGMNSATKEVKIAKASTKRGGRGEGLIGYSMVGGYSVKLGEKPVLDRTAKGIVAKSAGEGADAGATEEIEGVIEWTTDVNALRNKVGSHSVKGKLKFAALNKTLPVSATLTVIAPVVMMETVEIAVLPKDAPKLPEVVSGRTATGEIGGKFPVKWRAVDMAQLSRVGDAVEIAGVATIIGREKMPVKAVVRVVRGRVASTFNNGRAAIIEKVNHYELDASGRRKVQPKVIIDGEIPTGDVAGKRWSSYSHEPGRNAAKSLEATVRWDTACVINEIVGYFFTGGANVTPGEAVFTAADGSRIAVAETEESHYGDNVTKIRYRLAEPATVDAINVKFTVPKAGTFVNIYELEFLSEKLVAE